MKVVRIYDDADGTARLEDIDIPLAALPTAGEVSDLIGAEGVALWESNRASFVDYHPPTRRHLVPILAGVMEIELEDRTTRQIRAGDIVLMDNLEGRGHRTRWLEPGGRCVMIRVAADFDADRYRTVIP